MSPLLDDFVSRFEETTKPTAKKFVLHLYLLEIILSDAFYENLKKLRQDDDYVVKQISTLLLNRVSTVICLEDNWILVDYFVI